MAGFKVRCVSSKNAGFTVEKLYEINNNIIFADDGFDYKMWSKNGCTIENLNKWFEVGKDPVKFELVIEEFTKANLKTFMRAKYRDGEISIVYKGSDKHGDILRNGRYWSNLNDYSEDLIRKNNINNLDIIEVYEEPTDISNLLDPSAFGKLLWKRTEPRNFTKAEAAKILSEHLDEVVTVEGVKG